MKRKKKRKTERILKVKERMRNEYKERTIILKEGKKLSRKKKEK